MNVQSSTLPTEKTLLEKARISARRHSGVIGLVSVFFVLSIVYNGLTPLFEAPDELDHFRYAVWLADGKGLPHLVSDLQEAGHEIGQPPFYYLLVALLIMPFDKTDLRTVAPENPYWRQGAGPNVHYHSEAEDFPYRSTSLAVHVARLGSSLMGVITIVGTYSIARLLLPRFALLPAALVAFNPQFIFINSVISNDNLITALSTIILFILVKGLMTLTLQKWHYLLLGVLWGTAVLTKVSGLAIGAVILMGLVFIAYKSKHWQRLVSGILLVGLGFLVVAGWLFVRNGMLYGDPLAWDAFLNANKELIRPFMLTIGQALNSLSFTVTRTFWASFNYGLLAPAGFYLFTTLIMLCGFAGLIVWFMRTGFRQITDAHTLAYLLLASWCGIVSISLIRWMQQVVSTEQGRLLFPAIGSFAILISLGLFTLFNKHVWVPKLIVGLLAVSAAILPFFIIQPTFAQPKPLPLSFLPATQTNIQFGDYIELLGYDLITKSVQSEDPIELNLFWDNTKAIQDSYVVAVHVVDSSGEVISRVDSIPYNGRFATAVWQPNLPFLDSYTLPPVSNEAAPGLATIWLTLYPWGQIEQTLPVTVDNLDVGHNLVLTKIKIAPDNSINHTPSQPRADQVENLALLTGYDMEQTDSTVEITLYWQAQQATTTDYTVFVHILDQDGNLLAQGDSPPQQNTFPTSIWEAGETIKDTHTILLPDSKELGTYTMMVGLYNPITEQRLPVYTENGESWFNQQIELTDINLKQ